jgi:hypothetical protein
MKTVAGLGSCVAVVALWVVLAGAQTGVFFYETWDAGTLTGSFNSSFYGSLTGGQYTLQTLTGSNGPALRHRLLAGTTPGDVDYATQHFGDAAAGPVLSSGAGQHFQDFHIQYRVYYSPGFDFHTNYKQFIIGTQDDRRHDEACCNPWVAHYITIYAGSGGALLAEANNKQGASGQWIGLGANQNGYDGTNRFILQSGRWYTVEVRRRLNDAGADNGIYQMWVDGLLIADRRNLRLRVPWNGSFGSNYTYGTNFAMISDYPLQNVSREQSIYYDDVKFSGSPIGGGGSTTPPVPAPPTNVRVVR